MTPQLQTTLHNPEDNRWGDCVRACYASLLDLPIEIVPHFSDKGVDGETTDAAIQVWLRSQGLCEWTFLYDAQYVELETLLTVMKARNGGCHYLLGGTSATGVHHCVICFNDEIVWDPSPKKSGIVAPTDGYWWVYFIGKLV